MVSTNDELSLGVTIDIRCIPAASTTAANPGFDESQLSNSTFESGFWSLTFVLILSGGSSNLI